MADLPSGTVTFLFTDLEGSTRLWEAHHDAMHDALARHDDLLRAAIASHDGYVVKTTGDGVHAAFTTAHDAVGAAIDGQRALAAETWGDTGQLRVRMGIHTGEAQHREGDYYGTALNRAARVMSIAHGGQVLISDATERLLGDGSGPAFDLVDLGEHRLRDLAQATRVFQICAPGLEVDFPPPRSMDAFPGNLPVQLTSFVGRDEELDAVVDMLRSSRLVTLTGVGGVGKTRLALQIAAEVLPRFPDGAWLCELAAASDEVLMFQTVADAVGARQREAMSMGESIVEFLRDREVLVVLDNCEHLLIDAAWLASQLLQRAPKVQILATSREGLGVIGEQLVALASLPVPSAADAATAGAVESVRLFVDRAGAVKPGFALGPSNAASVAEVCRRLDGMPLAIELAAARVTAMSPAEIAERLDERFRLLTGGRRSRVERHQTLRATIEWSYSLLDVTERLVFDRLGVFVGSFDASAAEAVVTDENVERWDVLDSLASLVEKSMILAEDADDGTTRYWLLETLRAFAREQLDDADETDQWRRRHAAYYADYAERAGQELMGADELAWVRRVDADIDNLRAALTWGLDAPDQSDADLAVRILADMVGAFTRGRWDLAGWSYALLPRALSSEFDRRAAVIAGAADWLMLADDSDGAARLARQAIDDAGSRRVWAAIARGYFVLASVRFRQGQAADALDILREGHDALRSAGGPRHVHGPLHGVASLFCLTLGDVEGARREADAELEIAHATANPTQLGSALAYTGRAWFSEDPAKALAAFEESISLVRAGAGDAFYTLALGGAAQLQARAGNRPAAVEALRSAIAFDHDVGNRANFGLTIERAVATLARIEEDDLAAMCAGVVQSETITAFRSLPQVDRTMARVAERMGTEAYEAAFSRGAALAYEEVATTVLGELDRLLANP